MPLPAAPAGVRASGSLFLAGAAHTSADVPTKRGPGLSDAAFELVLADGTRVPLADELTLGRAPGNTLRFDDPSVSRRHARIVRRGDSAGTPVLEDSGSSYGTWLDGRRVGSATGLRDGSRIRIGDQELVVERVRSDSEAGRTLRVEPGESLVVDAVGPRIRSGYALKRLEAAEGARRWVLRDLRGGKIVRFSDEDAALLQLLDGRRSTQMLMREAERRFGAPGAARLARLLADLADRGLLAGTAPAEVVDLPTPRWLRPRETVWRGAGDAFLALYRHGGRILFTRPVLFAMALLALVGAPVFVYLVAARYGTPFVVARKIGLGGIVFLLGRFAIVALHETAHGLAMASYGRKVSKAGLKLVLVFPYAYVDTSEMWFEPRRRRIAVSAAGPFSDLTLAGLFSVCCLALSVGTVRDVFFQLAFAAYVGALFNLNPLLQRDGYNILVDVLREPGLRARARVELRRALNGGGWSSPALARYALLSIGWTFGAGLFTVALSVHYEAILAILLPTPVAWTFLAALWVAVFLPLAAMLAPRLLDRVRARRA
jgi:pSer/pThr/pTyr-binding forkhead associated (FHA) protein